MLIECQICEELVDVSEENINMKEGIGRAKCPSCNGSLVVFTQEFLEKHALKI